MPTRQCPTCGRYRRAMHRCPGPSSAMTRAILRPTPRGYNPRELAHQLRTAGPTPVAGTYDPKAEADKLEAALQPVRGVRERLARRSLRAGLERRFGRIDWSVTD